MRIGDFLFLKHVLEACRNFADQMFHCYLLLSLVGMSAKAKPALVTSRVAETSSESDFHFIMHKSQLDARTKQSWREQKPDSFLSLSVTAHHLRARLRS